MSNLNLTWLANNLTEHAIVFDIGCADMNDSIRIKKVLPTAVYYAFECANSWKEQNVATAITHDINYFHTAISDSNDHLTFYPSATLDGQVWPWSGSVCPPGSELLNDRWQWGNGYDVESITLATFCEQHNVVPDFVHIDVQGAEYKVFNNAGTVRPKIIWAEISEFHMYQTGSTYEDFNTLMKTMGYQEKFKDNCDALYIRNDLNLEEYK